MVKRRRYNLSTRELRSVLDSLGESDPVAYDIAHALVHDFVAVQNGHYASMAGRPGQRLYERASPALPQRAFRLFGIILRLLTTEFDQPPPPPRSPPPSSPPPRPPRRRYWRRKK